MPRVDFPNVDDASDYTVLPEGDYTCMVTEVFDEVSQAGNDMWKLHMRVDKGEYEGRMIFDNLVFTEKALPRVKIFAKACMLDVTKEIDMQPAAVLGKMVMVSVFETSYENASGEKIPTNKVHFAGYAPAVDLPPLVPPPVADIDDDLPF
jgi:hypothetical protein